MCPTTEDVSHHTTAVLTVLTIISKRSDVSVVLTVALTGPKTKAVLKTTQWGSGGGRHPVDLNTQGPAKESILLNCSIFQSLQFNTCAGMKSRLEDESHTEYFSNQRTFDMSFFSTYATKTRFVVSLWERFVHLCHFGAGFSFLLSAFTIINLPKSELASTCVLLMQKPQQLRRSQRCL